MLGFVAFLDLLGFSELIQREDFSDKFERYVDIIEKTLDTDTTGFQYIIFSDSLIINTKNNDKEQLLKLSTSISHISYRLLTELDLPICGCISVGRFDRFQKKWKHYDRRCSDH